MEHQAQKRIEHILNRVESLDELSAAHIIELRRISERSLVIDKWKVSPTDFQNWLDKVGGDDIRGVEYDARISSLVLKEYPGWMHEAAADVVREVFYQIREKLSAATGLRFTLTGSADYSLDDGSIKQADASLMESGAESPVVVLEVGISETTNKLYEDARRWLEESNGTTKLVILVDIQEIGRRDCSNDKWELSEADFQQTHYRALSKRILQWYRSKGIRVVGSFKLSVHLWYGGGGDRECILDKVEFSPGNLIDLTTIEDIPLQLGRVMLGQSNLDKSQRLFFPLRHLVDTLQNGFGDIEIQRVNHLAKEEQRRHLPL